VLLPSVVEEEEVQLQTHVVDLEEVLHGEIISL
jgi:hypothetical protein